MPNSKPARRAGRKTRRCAFMCGVISLTGAPAAVAQEGAAIACEAAAVSCVAGDVVIYMPAFFTQYNPITALDMVGRVPGFSIDSGDNVRGFGGAAGNVLIDGQRPSTKSADIRTVLSRIGAGDVARLELIRGGTGGLDVGGQAVVVNVIRKEGGDVSSTSPWEFSLLKRRPDGGVRPRGEISFTGRARGVDYTLGANVFATSLRFDAEEEITRFFGDDEERQRAGVFRDQGGGVNLNLDKAFDSGNRLRFNVEAEYVRSREDTTETRFLEAGGPDVALFTFPFEELEYEIGADYEHAFTNAFGVKIIGLFGREFEEFESGFEFLPAMGADDRSVFISDETSGETIGRLEFDWSGWERHAIQFGGEIVQNFIDSNADLLVDDGMGGLTPVAIDGANTRVSELRGEPFVTDSWRISSKLTLDLGFRYEFSRISQSGDNANSRFFTYPKPSAALTYSVSPQLQLRASVERDVNQLSFGEFVSSVNFDDEDIDFGNPDLRPERTWIFEAGFERRFGDIGVVEVTGFFDYVQDLEDLLPIGGIVEVPGNIGDGKRYGVRLNITTPLDFLGLSNSRLDSSLVVRDSSVEDPVTGLDREFSFLSNVFFDVEFQQDFPAQSFSWGWGLNKNGERAGFGLDEFQINTNELEIRAFIETTAIKGVKIRAQVSDAANSTSLRDRTVFQGSRALGVADFREVRRSRNGGGISLIFSGTF